MGCGRHRSWSASVQNVERRRSAPTPRQGRSLPTVLGRRLFVLFASLVIYPILRFWPPLPSSRYPHHEEFLPARVFSHLSVWQYSPLHFEFTARYILATSLHALNLCFLHHAIIPHTNKAQKE